MAEADSDDLLNAISRIKIEDEETKDSITKPASKENHESYFNWVDPDKFEDSGATAEQIITIIADKFLEDAKDQEISLKYNGVERIGDKGSLAYAYFHAGNLVEAKAALAEGRDFIRICSKNSFIDEEYLAGFDYVFDCLEVFFSVKENSKQEYQKPDWPVQNYKDLADKSKAAVLALKFYFHRQLRKSVKEQTEILNEMTSLDPDCPDWHYCKATSARFHRKANWSPQGGGGKTIQLKLKEFEDEIAELELAKSLSPDHPQIIMAYCLLVAELSKELKTNYEDWNTPLICGTSSFSNMWQVASFLKLECEKVLGIYDQCVRINATVAEIFMKLLHGRYRDFEISERCLRRALHLHPKSSKANHRLTGYFLRTKPPNFTEAEKYCSLALEYDPRNFPACSDLVQLLLRNPLLNEGRINDILDTYLKEAIVPLSSRNKSDLFFCKGLLQHASGHKLDAVESWINAQVELQDKLQFGDLKYKMDRFKWPEESLTIEKILETVEFANKDSIFSLGKEKQMGILLETLTNVKTEQRGYRQSGFQDRGGYNRGHYSGHNSSRGHEDFQARGYNRGHNPSRGQQDFQARGGYNRGHNSPRGQQDFQVRGRGQNPPRGYGQRFHDQGEASSSNNWRAPAGSDTKKYNDRPDRGNSDGRWSQL